MGGMNNNEQQVLLQGISFERYIREDIKPNAFNLINRVRTSTYRARILYMLLSNEQTEYS